LAAYRQLPEARRTAVAEHGGIVKSIAEKSLEITSLFEAEVFVWMMLKVWNHPLAEDKEFANGLLEDASEALRAAAGGQELVAGIPPASLNLVAAVWYAENCAIDSADVDSSALPARRAWLATVRRALPSCFCDPSDLGA
jgi:hypothetical protein